MLFFICYHFLHLWFNLLLLFCTDSFLYWFTQLVEHRNKRRNSRDRAWFWIPVMICLFFIIFVCQREFFARRYSRNLWSQASYLPWSMSLYSCGISRRVDRLDLTMKVIHRIHLFWSYLFPYTIETKPRKQP